MSDEGSASALVSESQLVARIREGDATAEDALVTNYRRAVLMIAVARTHDREAARDLTQEILLAVLVAVRAGHLREPEKLPAFIQGTARNLVNNYLRTQIRRRETELQNADCFVDQIEVLEHAERQRLFRKEMASLNILDQQILLFSLVDGHSLAEIARRLGLSHEAVRARKSRAIRKIEEKFARMSQK